MKDNFADKMMKTSQNTEVLSRLNNFRKSDKFCDIKLIIDGVKFPAHRNVLAAFSPYFDAMLWGDFPEAKTECVTLESIELSIMESLLEYAYTAEIELTNDNIQAMLHAANYLQVDILFKACCDFLETHLSAENCIRIYNLSEVYPCASLNEATKKFVLTHFLAVSQEVDFLELEAGKVIGIIDDDSLCVEKEEHVFDAVMRWMHYREDERKDDLPEVLNHVRLANVDPYFLHSRLKGTKSLAHSEACTKLFLDVLFYQALPNRSMELSSSFSRTRDFSPFNEVLLLFGNCKKASSEKEEKYLCVADNGEVVRDFEVPTRLCFSCSSTSNYEPFYVDGGTSLVTVFDYKEDAWKTTSVAVEWFTKALRNIDGRWYTFEHTTNKLELYDDQVWRCLPKPTAGVLRNPSVVSVNGMIYLVGGKTKDENPSTLIQQFDPHTETWTWVGDLPSRRECLKTCALNGKIYVFSGSIPNDSNSRKWPIEEFDVATSQCSNVGNIPEKFANHTISEVTAFRSNIYIELEKDNKREIQVYSPSSNSWSNFPPIPGFCLKTIRCPMRIENKKNLKQNVIALPYNNV